MTQVKKLPADITAALKMPVVHHHSKHPEQLTLRSWKVILVCLCDGPHEFQSLQSLRHSPSTAFPLRLGPSTLPLPFFFSSVVLRDCRIPKFLKLLHLTSVKRFGESPWYISFCGYGLRFDVECLTTTVELQQKQKRKQIHASIDLLLVKKTTPL